jgi:hypothetical protein
MSSKEERRHYHLLVEHVEARPESPEDDVVFVRAGVPIARNMRRVAGLHGYHHDTRDGYAAHTRSFNAFSIGLALCGMRGAADFRPAGDVSPGPSPITIEQVRALLSLSVQASRIYELPVSAETFFTHREAEALHGVDQLPEGPKIWKWNVEWIPGFAFELGEAGPFLREQLQRWLDGRTIDDRLYDPPAGESSYSAVGGMEG